MNDNFNEKLDLDELFKEKKQSYEHKIKIYQKILSRVHKKLKPHLVCETVTNLAFF